MLSTWINEITLWIESLGYGGIFLAGFGFFPSNALSMTLGAVKSDSLIKLTLVGGIGGIVGSGLSYLLGYHFRDKDLLKFLNGKGKFLNISEESYNSSLKYLKRWGFVFIFFSRFIGGVRSVTPIVAGYLKYPFKVVAIAVFLGNLIHIYILVYIGSRVGVNWKDIKEVLDIFNSIIFVIVGLAILGYVWFRREKFFGRGKENYSS